VPSPSSSASIAPGKFLGERMSSRVRRTPQSFDPSNQPPLKRPKKAKAKAKAEATATASSWRETLFFWRGELRYASPASDEPGVVRSSQKGILVWSGTWVGSASLTLPSDETFAASPNTFELRAPYHGGTGLDHVPSHVPDCSVFSGAFKGQYQLDGETTSDKSHTFRVACISKEADIEADPVGTVVAASGDTPFGRFVSLGTVSRRGAKDSPAAKCGGRGGPCQLRDPAGPGERAIILTLARRYVDKADPRAKWKDPRETDLAALLPSPALASQPWRALPAEYSRAEEAKGKDALVEWDTHPWTFGLHPDVGSTRGPSGPVAWKCENRWR